MIIKTSASNFIINAHTLCRVNGDNRLTYVVHRPTQVSYMCNVAIPTESANVYSVWYKATRLG